MIKRRITFALALTMMLSMVFVFSLPGQAAAADVLRGLVYNINGDYIEVTPSQYFTMKNSSNTSVKNLLFDPASPQPLRALVDTKSMVYTPATYFSAGKNFSLLTDTQQTADLVMRNPGKIALSAAGAAVTTPGPVISSITMGDGTANISPTISGIIGNPVITFAVDPLKDYTSGACLLSKDATISFTYMDTPIEVSVSAANSQAFMDLALGLFQLYGPSQNDTGVLGQNLILNSGLQVTFKAANNQVTNYTINFTAI